MPLLRVVACCSPPRAATRTDADDPAAVGHQRRCRRRPPPHRGAGGPGASEARSPRRCAPTDSVRPTDVPPVRGGTLRIAGEAERRLAVDARQPVQCELVLLHADPHGDRDAAAVDQDLQGAARSCCRVDHPNADSTRCGTSPCARACSFTDGTPLDADAVDLQPAGDLVAACSCRRDARPSPAPAAIPNGPLMIDKTGDHIAA